MKKLLLFCLFTLTAFGSDVEVYFSPKGGIQQAIIDHINEAQTEILMQTYSFTSQPIAIALVDAKKRGVNVMVIIDKNSFEASVSSILKKGKVKVFEDGKHAIAHAKIIIFDKLIVEEGSYNYTGNAENNNSEDANFITDAAIAKRYIANFDAHLSHSEAK